MPYAFKDGKLITRSLEYSVTYHCNLRCSSCTHMSPFQKEFFPSLESFSKDINRLAEEVRTPVLRLLGGEPLLNPDLISFLITARESGISDKIMITTNGLLLHKISEELLENVDILLVSLYPQVNLANSLESLKPKIQEFDTELWVQKISSFRTTAVTTPHPNDWLTERIFETCRDVHVFNCHMIHEGYLYKCAVPPFLPQYLSKLGINDYDPSADGFDIHGSSIRAKSLRDYLTSNKPLNACRYCLGSLGKDQEQHQLSGEMIKNPAILNINRDEHIDRKKLYFGLASEMSHPDSE